MKKMSFAEAMWAMTERGCRVRLKGHRRTMWVEGGSIQEAGGYNDTVNENILSNQWRILKTDRTPEIKQELWKKRRLEREMKATRKARVLVAQ